eukprot:135220-Pyramimonas_sp.AAC.1
MATAKDLLLAQLRDVRAKLEAKKSDITIHTNVGHRLAKAKKRQAQIAEELRLQNESIKEAEAKRDDLVAKQKALDAEVKALNQQLVDSIPQDAPGRAVPRVPSLELPTEVLQGKDEIKEML